MRRFALLCSLCLVLAACGSKTGTVQEMLTQIVRLPRGQQIRCEVVYSEMDLRRGMMFRDSLAPDRGMLFLHGSTGKYPYWMYQVRIPLDIIFMDQNRRVVEISSDTPPCKTVASQCPQYGGHYPTRYVLELAGGMAAKYGVRVGDTLEF